jgi:hypothetical protein
MSVDAKIVGGPEEVPAAVASTGQLCTAPWRPPTNKFTAANVGQVKALTGFLLDSADEDSLVYNGSSTAKDYAVKADADRIKWINELRLVIHDSQLRIDNNEQRRFGSAHASGLSNGLLLKAEQGGVVTSVFVDPVQRIGHFYRYAGGPGVGAGIENGIINSVDGIAAGTDLLVVRIRFEAPIGLFPGSLDRVYITVQDDLSGLTLFEVQYSGTQELL